MSTFGFASALTIWPDTGQDKCYDIYGSIICPQKGQPFYGQDAQYQGHQPGYTKLDANGNSLPESASSWVTVYDNVTGLTWEVKTDDDTIHDKDINYSWCNSTLENPGDCDDEDNTESFVDNLNNAKFGGYSDWRLPTITELASLLDSNAKKPAINTSYFPLTEPSFFATDIDYWSSTVKVGDSNASWEVYFDQSIFGHIVNYSSKSISSHVRAVRGGTGGRPNKYVDNHNGTVTDTDTGLMWQQDPCFEVEGISGLLSYIDWEKALAYVASLNRISFAGHSDWRLPNRNELQSFVDYSREKPAFNTNFFNGEEKYYYFQHWSSTTAYGENEDAWVVDFSSGKTLSWPKTNGGSVRVVRTAQQTKPPILPPISPDDAIPLSGIYLLLL